MANTYTQCYFHLVFAVKFRHRLIDPSWREDLEKYITGIIQNNGHKLISIYAMPDHIHILIGYCVSHPLPDLVNEIKTSSNAWIKYHKLQKRGFAWQRGYGAFTLARSDIGRVARYIEGQQEHHERKAFRAEYLKLLQENEVDFDPGYLFEFFDPEPGVG